MGYLKGFLTTLGITYPSFLFIEIYLESMTIANYFTDLFSGQWEMLLEVCETAITEPINIFFEPAGALRIIFAFLPWVLAAFVASFFFKRKHAARGGVFSVLTIYLIAEAVYFLVFQGELYTLEMFTEANHLYGYLIIIGVTTIFGVIFGLISPFKKDGSVKIQRITERSEPTLIQHDDDYQEDDPTTPYYMPTESPSRDSYMDTQQRPVEKTRPVNCEFCGSYLDSDTEFCSVCGNRVVSD